MAVNICWLIEYKFKWMFCMFASDHVLRWISPGINSAGSLYISRVCPSVFGIALKISHSMVCPGTAKWNEFSLFLRYVWWKYLAFHTSLPFFIWLIAVYCQYWEQVKKLTLNYTDTGCVLMALSATVQCYGVKGKVFWMLLQCNMWHSQI